ncbi:Plant Cell Wall Expansin [Abortiporus biennis]
MVQLAATFSVLAAMFNAVVATPLNQNVPAKRAGEVTHSGQATYFEVGLGACGHTDSNSYPVVAISSQIYGSGGNCNQWLHITNKDNGHTAYGQVRDECPGCGEYSIDLSPSLFTSLASGGLNEGVLPNIQWNYEPVGFSPPN